MNKLIKYSILSIFFTAFVSCEETKKETPETIEITSEEPIEETDDTTTHFLDYNGSKVYLPSRFEKYSYVKYQNLIDSLLTNKE